MEAMFDMSAQRRWAAGVEQPGYDSIETCWEWMNGRSTDGYGYFRPIRGGQGVLAHRWAYSFFRDEIPAGLFVDHLCRNRACCNPWHLEPVTPRVNVHRGDMARRRDEAHQKTTACQRGHEWNETNGNTGRDSRGFRRCLACARMRTRGEII